MYETEDLSAVRLKALETLCAGTWDGTDYMVGELVRQSQKKHGWKPARAAMAHGLEASSSDRVWMTPEEFVTWIGVAKARASRLKLGVGHPRKDLGITDGRMYDLMRPERMAQRGLKVRKAEALACAHYALGLPKPVENGDTEAFSAWFQPRFGTQQRITEFLGVKAEWIRERLRGWGVNTEGRRVERKVEGYAIRALDWVWHNGPVCPYGERAPVQVWPGQVELGS